MKFSFYFSLLFSFLFVSCSADFTNQSEYVAQADSTSLEYVAPFNTNFRIKIPASITEHKIFNNQVSTPLILPSPAADLSSKNAPQAADFIINNVAYSEDAIPDNPDLQFIRKNICTMQGMPVDHSTSLFSGHITVDGPSEYLKYFDYMQCIAQEILKAALNGTTSLFTVPIRFSQEQNQLSVYARQEQTPFFVIKGDKNKAHITANLFPERTKSQIEFDYNIWGKQKKLNIYFYDESISGSVKKRYFRTQQRLNHQRRNINLFCF